MKNVSEVVVAQAKRKFRKMVHALPSGSPITLGIMHAWAEANFRQYDEDDVVVEACMPEATELAGEGVLRPTSPLFHETGFQIHDDYRRA
jgi:hypothetical protein